MYYAIIATDAADSLPRRREARPAHIARIQSLADEGRVLIAGPHPAIDSEDPGPAGFSGSLVVAEFPSLEAAEAWAAEDPYTTAGVFETIDIKPFKQTFP